MSFILHSLNDDTTTLLLYLTEKIDYREKKKE